ncbi:MAG: hypothetical protein WDW36_007475 [Sanguina aurantia]
MDPVRRHVEAETRYHARRQRGQRRGSRSSDDDYGYGFDGSPDRDRRRRDSFCSSEGHAPPDRGGRGGRGRQVGGFDSPRGGFQGREAKSGRDGGGGGGSRGPGNGRESVQLAGGLEASRALAQLISAMEGGRRDTGTR